MLTLIVVSKAAKGYHYLHAGDRQMEWKQHFFMVNVCLFLN